MSNVRDYLLTFDKDKKGAANIASSTAQGILYKHSQIYPLLIVKQNSGLNPLLLSISFNLLEST